MTIARLNLDGSLDNSFDADGKLIIPFGQRQAYTYDVEIQPDGKVVVGGGIQDSRQDPNPNFLLVRRNSDGSPDLSFGQSGTVETSISATSDYLRSLALQTDGKIIAAGHAASPTGRDDFALVRYLGQ